MGKHEKLLIQILSGASDANIPFDGMCELLRYLGFEVRTRGSHHNIQKRRSCREYQSSTGWE
jgi:hypothetical protein